MLTRSPPRGPAANRYDAIIVGGGMAGLTSGALLARAGRSILVVEGHDSPGGFCTSLVSGGWRFDPAVHFIMGAGSGRPGAGLVNDVLAVLGVAGSCAFAAADPFFEARFPDLTVRVGAGRQGFIDALGGAFPDEEAGVRALIELGDELYDEFVRFPLEPRSVDLARAPLAFPNLVRYRNATVAEVTDRHLVDPRLKALYTALFPYVGLPPSQASFVEWATMLSSFVADGAFYCRGGFQRLADAFADGLLEQGGELLLARRVRRIRLDEGRAVGVELDDGQIVNATDIVATGDARELFSVLVGPEHLPRRYRRRLNRADTSISVFEMYLGTDLDLEELGVAHETIVWQTWDLDAAFAAALGGETSSVMVTVPTLTDPTIAPAGLHQVVIAGIAPLPTTEPNLDRIAADHVDAAEAVIPGLGDHLVHVAGLAGERAAAMPPPLHQIDDIYGWAATPRQVVPGVLRQSTPIPGLTLAGQWTQPGHGVWTVIASGIQATRLVLGQDAHRGLTPLEL